MINQGGTLTLSLPCFGGDGGKTPQKMGFPSSPPILPPNYPDHHPRNEDPLGSAVGRQKKQKPAFQLHPS